MSNHYLFNESTVGDLSLVIDDKEKEFEGIELIPLKDDGKVIYHFAIDAHEIGQYCFPVDIQKTYKQEELEKIVDSQIAYYDIFNKHNRKAIIFDDYKKELEGTKDYFRSFNDSARREGNLSLYQAFRNNIQNITNLSSVTSETEHTDFVVAFNLALISFGVNRFNEIYPKRIVFESEYNEDDLLNPLIEFDLSDKYVGKLCGEVKDSLLKNGFPATNEHSIRRDVLSISKVYYLNRYYIEKNDNRRILYFSSTRRTKFILEAIEKFKDDEQSVYSAFNPWRTPIQIYLYLMLREVDKSENISVKATLNLLKEVKEWFEELDTSSYTNYRRKKEISENFERLLSQRKEKHLQNLNSVESSQLGKIASLYELTSGKNKEEIDKNIKIYFRDDKKEIEEYLSKLTPQGIDVDVLLRQIEVDLKLRNVISDDFAKNDDVIINCYDTFPFILFIENEDFKQIINDLFDYWIEYYQKTQHKNANAFDRNRILTILNNFLELDKVLTTRSSDYYTVSTMLHLVNPRKNSDEIAENYINKLEKRDLIGESNNLLYLKATILRRLNKYPESIEVCDKYKSKDFRFGYCRALAIIGSIYNLNDNAVKNQLEKIDSAINDLIFSFEEIEKSQIEKKNEFLCSISSDIVYLSSLFYLHSVDEQNIKIPAKPRHEKIAKDYLDVLRSLKPKDNGCWDFLFPDYFFREAFYEYVTIFAFDKSGQSDEFSVVPTSKSWQTRVESAISDIEKAIKYSTVREKTDFYKSLQGKLTKLKEKL